MDHFEVQIEDEDGIVIKGFFETRGDSIYAVCRTFLLRGGAHFTEGDDPKLPKAKAIIRLFQAIHMKLISHAQKDDFKYLFYEEPKADEKDRIIEYARKVKNITFFQTLENEIKVFEERIEQTLGGGVVFSYTQTSSIKNLMELQDPSIKLKEGNIPKIKLSGDFKENKLDWAPSSLLTA